VAQASGAAVMVTSLFASEELYHEPITVGADETLCSGCGLCINVCAYSARELNPEKGLVEVNEILCEACGACAAACFSGAAQQKNLSDQQLLNMVESILA
jgi:heterodisulfide reductase subunit A